MRFEFDAPLGQRYLNRYVLGITVDYVEEGLIKSLWFCWGTRTWVKADIPTPQRACSHAPCNSFRAFKRHLRKHPELKGCCVTLCSRMPENDIRAYP